ncbi:MAG TPA: ribosome-associated translation inhibitor RaiA [Dongiaceae bacterium]|jgi:ribosomal subunit interface protein|nr:ribosome-associated translation inhibitor RaiA [Dongiaceae bacterium]
MNLTVKGKNIDVGEALRTHVAQSLDHGIAKYFGNPIEATVTFSKQTHLFSAELSVHIGRGILVHAEESADQAYAAFDLAMDHLAKRMRRYKRRLRDHHRAETQSFRAAQYILAPETDEEAEPTAANGNQAPAVIAEMQTEIPTLTVGEAVMRLDLSDLKAMMFLNRAHGGLNMVYRRNDGNIGWVDPRLGASAGSAAGAVGRARQ